ncbi:alpha/beta fold hydrolase [Streptosporangium sp. NPDC000239]|uniref:alpha/beta fold hydrolase n=1 Tax=Streptosporangium sp. NPDC000239 TaxID=3154248 RepID=UPI00331982CE
MSIEERHTHVPIAGSPLHVVETGDPLGRPVLFLHGWPESWRTWRGVMEAAGTDARLLAVDLPGIGDSTGPAPGGSKLRLAGMVHELVLSLGLTDLTLVGHDAGGMIAYAYLRRYGAARVVIMNTVIPGVAPWKDVLANPYIWHFGFHAVPALPETLVRGRQAAYFDYFYDVLSVDPARITPESRRAHAAAYARDTALTAGFDLYRALPQDALDNAALAEAGPGRHTPPLPAGRRRGRRHHRLRPGLQGGRRPAAGHRADPRCRPLRPGGGTRPGLEAHSRLHQVTGSSRTP